MPTVTLYTWFKHQQALNVGTNIIIKKCLYDEPLMYYKYIFIICMTC